MITLTAVPGTDGAAWHVSEDTATLGIWQRTDDGATFSDSTGARLATITAVGGGSPCCIVAGEGSQAGKWSGIAHAILAGSCEIITADEPAGIDRTCDDCGAGPGEECTWSCSSRWGFDAADSE
jgi:hypothetical protein